MKRKEQLKFNPGAVITEPGSSIKNKTGGWRSMRPIVDKNKCTKCGICWMFCPDNAINVAKTGAAVDYDYCKGCLICVQVCPVKAIVMKKEEK